MSSLMVQSKVISVAELFKIEEELNVASRAVDFARNRIGGIQRLKFPEQFDDMLVMVVAYSSRNGYTEWAAYTGYPTGSEAYARNLANGMNFMNKETVIDNGDKLNQKVAEYLFPDFTKNGFRYRL